MWPSNQKWDSGLHVAWGLRSKRDMDLTPERQIRPTEYMLARTTILIVDDEAGPRESLKLILSPAHKVVCADSGSKALEILGSREVDLVTIDLIMPGMKGEELMRAIRAGYPSVEIIVITGNGSVQTAVEGLRQGISDYISKPFDVVEVSSAVSRALARKRSRALLVQFLEGVGTVLGKDRDSSQLLDDLQKNPELQGKLSGAIAMQERLPRREPATTDDAKDPTLEFLDVLAQALESRDGELRKHAQRVGFFANLVGEQLGVDEDTREYIRTSSFLHDIGKVALTDEDKERAQLRSIAEGISEEEHPEIGAKLVQPLGFEERVVGAIRHHHEHWNGDGYPDGLRGENIPLAARVIAVVDTFDKLTSERPGDGALSAEEAAAELEKHSGSRFDPALVALFVALIGSGGFELQARGETH